jgi:hypothetical protein
MQRDLTGALSPVRVVVGPCLAGAALPEVDRVGEQRPGQGQAAQLPKGLLQPGGQYSTGVAVQESDLSDTGRTRTMRYRRVMAVRGNRHSSSITAASRKHECMRTPVQITR